MSKAAEGVIQARDERRTIDSLSAKCSFSYCIECVFYLAQSYETYSKREWKLKFRKKKNSKRFVFYLIAPPLIMGGLQSQISIRR